MTNVSSTMIKAVVALVLVAALIAAGFNSNQQTGNSLRGANDARKLSYSSGFGLQPAGGNSGGLNSFPFFNFPGTFNVPFTGAATPGFPNTGLFVPGGFPGGVNTVGGGNFFFGSGLRFPFFNLGV